MKQPNCAAMGVDSQECIPAPVKNSELQLMSGASDARIVLEPTQLTGPQEAQEGASQREAEESNKAKEAIDKLLLLLQPFESAPSVLPQSAVKVGNTIDEGGHDPGHDPSPSASHHDQALLNVFPDFQSLPLTDEELRKRGMRQETTWRRSEKSQSARRASDKRARRKENRGVVGKSLQIHQAHCEAFELMAQRSRNGAPLSEVLGAAAKFDSPQEVPAPGHPSAAVTRQQQGISSTVIKNSPLSRQSSSHKAQLPNRKRSNPEPHDHLWSFSTLGLRVIGLLVVVDVIVALV